MASLLSEALDFAFTKAVKHSDFKLKTEQKSIIEAVVDFFTPFARTVTFLKNFLQIFVRTTSSQLLRLLQLLLQLFRFAEFVSAFQRGSPLSLAFRNC